MTEKEVIETLVCMTYAAPSKGEEEAAHYAIAAIKRLKDVEAQLARYQNSERTMPSPHLSSGDPGYWVEKLVAQHPLPAAPHMVLIFCNDQFHRLGCDGDRFAKFMEIVFVGHSGWCAHWKANGNRYVTGLEKWLAGQGWKKSPPQPEQPRERGPRDLGDLDD